MPRMTPEQLQQHREWQARILEERERREAEEEAGFQRYLLTLTPENQKLEKRRRYQRQYRKLNPGQPRQGKHEWKHRMRE